MNHGLNFSPLSIFNWILVQLLERNGNLFSNFYEVMPEFWHDKLEIDIILIHTILYFH